MPLYGGIDLHANNSVVVLLNEQEPSNGCPALSGYPLSLAYYHLALPHRCLRQPLPEPEPTRGSGSLRRWQPVTPAMAASLTDHVWTTTELLSYRVPPHFLDT